MTRPLPPPPSAPRLPPIPKPSLPTDKAGRTVPAWLVTAWQGRDELAALEKQVKVVRHRIEAGHTANDKTMRRVSATTLSLLQRCEGELRDAMPYALCPYCQGADGGCKVCVDGFVSKTVWDAAIPDAVKQFAVG